MFSYTGTRVIHSTVNKSYMHEWVEVSLYILNENPLQENAK